MGHFFPLPNEIFCLGLSASEIAIYAYLMYIEDRKTYTCWASHETIGKALDLNRKTVGKYVHQLEEKQLITTEQTKVRLKDGRVQNGCLLYNILPISTAVRYYLDRLSAKLELDAAEQRAKKRLEDYNRKNPDKPVCATFTDGEGNRP
jgi:predicted transcriptional regulator